MKILSLENSLLQVSLHTAKHSHVEASGMRLHLDVERIVTSSPIDWPVFLKQGRRLRVKTTVYFYLRLAHELLGALLQPGLLAALRPPVSKIKVLRRTDLFNPYSPKLSRPENLFFNAVLFDDLPSLIKVVLPRLSLPKDGKLFTSLALEPSTAPVEPSLAAGPHLIRHV